MLVSQLSEIENLRNGSVFMLVHKQYPGVFFSGKFNKMNGTPLNTRKGDWVSAAKFIIIKNEYDELKLSGAGENFGKDPLDNPQLKDKYKAVQFVYSYHEPDFSLNEKTLKHTFE